MIEVNCWIIFQTIAAIYHCPNVNQNILILKVHPASVHNKIGLHWMTCFSNNGRKPAILSTFIIFALTRGPYLVQRNPNRIIPQDLPNECSCQFEVYLVIIFQDNGQKPTTCGLLDTRGGQLAQHDSRSNLSWGFISKEFRINFKWIWKYIVK